MSMGRRRFSPRLDTLEHRLALSGITISGGSPQPPTDIALASIDPTGPVDAPTPDPGEMFPGIGNPVIIAPAPNPNPLDPTPIVA